MHLARFDKLLHIIHFFDCYFSAFQSVCIYSLSHFCLCILFWQCVHLNTGEFCQWRWTSCSGSESLIWYEQQNKIIHANTGETVDCHTVRLYVLLQIKGTSSLRKHKTNTIYSLAPPTSTHFRPPSPTHPSAAKINRSKIFMFVQKSIMWIKHRVHALYCDQNTSDTPVDRWPCHRSARRRAHYLRGTKQTETARPSPAAVRIQPWQVISADLRYIQL